MKLLSVFTGKVSSISFNGETVQSGIQKSEVKGKVFVSQNGLAGDEQANLKVHGGINKAVYAYPSEHYDFWKNEHQDKEFHPGIFGENLSVIGLNEQSVCVGDEYKIGDVVLKVTTPRLPCNKLGIKMKDKSFIKKFLHSGKSGFYFKVLKEGEIGAGDEIEKISEDGFELRISELVELKSTRKEDKDLLRKAISAPNLIESWKNDFSEKLENSDQGK